MQMCKCVDINNTDIKCYISAKIFNNNVDYEKKNYMKLNVVAIRLSHDKTCL